VKPTKEKTYLKLKLKQKLKVY